jgi:hypothetical protein
MSERTILRAWLDRSVAVILTAAIVAGALAFAAR